MAPGKLAAFACSFVAMVVATPVRAQGPNPSQKAAMFAKSSVVRVVGYWEVSFDVGGQQAIEYVGGMGSGFFASADGFVVTNAHVVEQIHDGEEKAKEVAFGQVVEKVAKAYADELSKMTDEQKGEIARAIAGSAKATANAYIVLPDGTKMNYQVRSYGKPGTGTDVAVIKVETKDAPNLPIGDSDKVQVQDRVLALGYPGAADMQGLLDDKSQLEASINDGAVSALKRTSAGESIIQISAAITHGNSGGPTINEAGEVIGLSTFGSKGEVQGFNFIVATSTVKQFTTEAKADLTPSATIKHWRKGLEAMWAFDLDGAIAEFEEVLTLYPTHSEAGKAERLARQMKKEGKNKPPVKVATPAVGAGSGSGSGASAGSASKDKPAANTAPAVGATSGGGGGGAAAGIVVTLLILGIGIGVVVVMKKKKPAGPPGPQAYGAPPMAPPHMPPPGHPAHTPQGGTPQMHAPHMPPPPGGMMMPGNGPAPVAKTMAIQPGGQPPQGPVAATAFGSLTLGTLTCSRGLLMGQRFSLTAQGLLIGRQPGLAQIVINDPRSSAKHVWIGYEQGVLVAIDQGTTNGTFVNDVRNGRISRHPLRDGDTVIVSEPDCLSLTIKLS